MANSLTKDDPPYAGRNILAWMTVALITWLAVTVWAIQHCFVIPGSTSPSSSA